MGSDKQRESESWVVVYSKWGGLRVLLEGGQFYTAFTNRPGRPRITADEGMEMLLFDEAWHPRSGPRGKSEKPGTELPRRKTVKTVSPALQPQVQ